MKIIAYDLPTTTRISSEDFSLTIRPFAPAARAHWDELDPDDADYIMVPFTFLAQVPALDAWPQRIGGDIMLPFVFRSAVSGAHDVREELRNSIVRAFLRAFPLYERYPAKHVFIDNGDMDVPCVVLRNSVLFKTNATYRDPDARPVPYPVPDPGPPGLIREAEVDLSFQGHVQQHPIRQRLSHWSLHQKELAVEFRSTAKSFHVESPDKRAQMARESFELMLRSKYVLSPRGRGPTSRRFFEILAHGRIPVLISDAARLPLESVLDYDRFVVRVPEGFISLIPDYIRRFEFEHDLSEASGLARRAYLDYFAPGSFRRYVETVFATEL